MKVGDLVRYRQGSCHMIGIIIEEWHELGDYVVFWNIERFHRKQLCRPRNMELLSGG